MIVTVTERGEFQRCRALWDWASFNREGYQSFFAKPALQTGRLWHMTQAEWALHPEEDPNGLCLSLSQQMVDELAQTYLENIGAPISPLELDPIYDSIKTVLTMVGNYKEVWGNPIPDGFTLLAPEQTCVIPVPGTQGDKCEVCMGRNQARFYNEDFTVPMLYSPPDDPLGGWWDPGQPCPNPECHFGILPEGHKLAGTLDGLLQDDAGRLWVLERKTYGQRPKIEVLNMQDQFLAYLWIVSKLNMGPVGGLAYDGAWKRKDGKPPKGGTLADLFLRTPLTRNSHEFDSFGHQLAGLVRDMAYNPNIYINRKWDGCWDCDFVEPCIAREKGEDWMYILGTRYAKRPKVEDSTRELKTHDPD